MSDISAIKQEFVNPHATYRPQPFWFLNHEYKREELLRQIQEMHEKGVGGVVLHSRHGKKTEYMSDSYLESLKFCVEECQKRGMVVWLYDEDNWPSGTFGGKLTQQHKEYRMRYLRVEEQSVSKSTMIEIDFPKRDNNELITILAYRVLERNREQVILDEDPIDLTALYGQSWCCPDDADYKILVYWECEIAEKVTFGSGYYLDTMNPEAVSAFIDVAYEPFNYLKDYFGATIQGVFTDEPGLMIHDGFFGVEALRTEVKQLDASLPGLIFAWTRDLLGRFESDKGYDLKPLLGALLYQVGERSQSVREDYYQAVTDWYVDAYHRSISNWCNSNDLKYIGHTLEEPLWGQARSQGNQTKVLQQFDYPGLDYLTHGIGTKENPHRILSVKCAASVAHLEGKQRVACESFGASNHGYSMRQRRLDANFMAFLGVNLFIPHAFYFSFEGYRKTDFPPTEFYHAPHWEHYRSFADYIGRLSLLGTLGSHTAHLLLVSPIHTIYQDMFENGEANMQPESDRLFSMLSDRFLRHRIDYDYVDECQLENAIVTEDGSITFPNSSESFQIIVLPGMASMSTATAEKLLTYVHAGGTLIIAGDAPFRSHSREGNALIQRTVSTLFPSEEPGVWFHYGKGKTTKIPLAQLMEDDGQSLCKLLVENIEDTTLHSWKIPSEKQEDIIITKRMIDGQLFTWLMNWSDQPVTISYDLGLSEIVEEWDLETGKTVVLKDAELSEFTIIPGQLRIITTQPNQERQIAIPSKMSHSIALSPTWEFQTDDPNVFILDKWEVTLNDRESRMNATMPGQVNTYRTRFSVEEGLKKVLADKGGVQLIIDDLEQTIPSHIGFLHKRRDVEIFLNGKKLPALEHSEWQDKFYKSVDLTSNLKSGENIVEILTISLLEPMRGLHFPAFLVGHFTTDFNGHLAAPSKQIRNSWSEVGYPYFSGKASYHQSFTIAASLLEQEGVSVWLEIEEVKETAAVWVNGIYIDTKLWPSYSWNITKAVKAGHNDLRVQVANTLENLYCKHPVPSGIIGKAEINVKSNNS